MLRECEREIWTPFAPSLSRRPTVSLFSLSDERGSSSLSRPSFSRGRSGSERDVGAAAAAAARPDGADRKGTERNGTERERRARGGEEKGREGRPLDCGRSTLMRIYCLSNNKPERLKE